MSEPPSSATTVRHEILAGLAQALALLSTRVQPQGDAARKVAVLAARAEAIAAEAWSIGIAPMPASDRVAALARDFKAFINDAAILAQRAAREAAASREVAQEMHRYASELNKAASELDGVVDIAAVRARLRPLATSLEALPARLEGGTEVVNEVAALGARATGLADCAESLHASGRRPGPVAVAIYRGLRQFAEDAAAIAAVMSVEAGRAQRAVVELADRADRLASPEAAAAAQRRSAATGRMSDVIAQGNRERQAAEPHPAKPPLRGMSWG